MNANQVSQRAIQSSTRLQFFYWRELFTTHPWLRDMIVKRIFIEKIVSFTEFKIMYVMVDTTFHWLLITRQHPRKTRLWWSPNCSPNFLKENPILGEIIFKPLSARRKGVDTLKCPTKIAWHHGPHSLTYYILIRAVKKAMLAIKSLSAC